MASRPASRYLLQLLKTSNACEPLFKSVYQEVNTFMPRPNSLLKRSYSKTAGQQSDNVLVSSNVNESRLYLRPATAEDYLDIVTLRAHDAEHMRYEYLVYSYHDYLKQSDITMTVGEIEGEIVAFGINHVGIEGSLETIARTSRVKPGFAKKNYLSVLHWGSMFMSAVLQGQRAIGYSPVIPGHSYKVYDYRLQWQFESFPGQTGPKGPAYKHTSPEPDPLILLTSQTLCAIGDNRELRQYVFPSDRFVMDVFTGRFVPQNYRYIMERKDNFYGFMSQSLQEQIDAKETISAEKQQALESTRAVIMGMIDSVRYKNTTVDVNSSQTQTNKGSEVTTNQVEDTKEEKLTQEIINTDPVNDATTQATFKGLVSYNTWLKVPVGYLSHIEIYGTPSSDKDVENHLRQHIREIRRRNLHGGVNVTCEETHLGIPFGDIIRETCESEGLYCPKPKPTKRMICKTDLLDRLSAVTKSLDPSGDVLKALANK